MKIKSIISILIIATIALQFNGCSEPCGPVKVLNPITELSLAVGDSVYIDLEGDPPVFNENARRFFINRLDDSIPIFNILKIDVGLIQIEGKDQGIGVIRISGECDFEAYDYFDLEITIINNIGD